MAVLWYFQCRKPPQDSTSMSIDSVPKICESCVMGNRAGSTAPRSKLAVGRSQGGGCEQPLPPDSFQISPISPVSQWSSARLALAQPSRQPLLEWVWIVSVNGCKLLAVLPWGRHLIFTDICFSRFLRWWSEIKFAGAWHVTVIQLGGSSYHFQDSGCECWYLFTRKTCILILVTTKFSIEKQSLITLPIIIIAHDSWAPNPSSPPAIYSLI